MASPTKQTKVIRRRKRTRQGKKRKIKLRNEGTTLSAKKLFQSRQGPVAG